MNLKQLVEQRAVEASGEIGYRFLPNDRDELCLTYGQLFRRVQQLASDIKCHIPAGQRVLLIYPAGLEFICAFYACVLADVVAVPLPLPKADDKMQRLAHVIRDCAPAAILSQTATLDQVRALLPDPMQATVVATDIAFECEQTIVSPCKADLEVAFLQYTSGSTGNPKGVIVSHDNLLANLKQIERAFGHTRDSSGVIWLPHYHDMGLIGGILQPLFVGFPVTLFSPISFVQRPLRWLQAIHKYRSTTSGGPNFAYDLCLAKADSAKSLGLDLSSWAVAFIGAEPVKADTLDTFAAAFSDAGFRRSAFVPCYGLAEATLLVASANRERPAEIIEPTDARISRTQRFALTAKDSLVSSGVAAEGTDVRIARIDSDDLSEDGEVGEIVVRSPSVSSGYWNRRTDAPHGGHPLSIRTGDLGFLLDSQLFVTGRLVDLIVIRGRNIFPEDIEATAEQAEQRLAHECAVAFCVEGDSGEEVVLVQEISARTLRSVDLRETRELVSHLVLQHHGVCLSDFVPVKTGSLARTSSGKISRSATRQLYMARKLRPLTTSKLD
ncbi:acyl-CoA synthetase (AMP-forming)/AMP-acid ligase II [Paraburkholderia sp. 35.1]